MCEYCEYHKKKKSKILTSCNFCGSAKMQILGKYMDIWGDEKKFYLFKKIYHPSFYINYCPMCGKRLEE